MRPGARSLPTRGAWVRVRIGMCHGGGFVVVSCPRLGNLAYALRAGAGSGAAGASGRGTPNQSTHGIPHIGRAVSEPGDSEPNDEAECAGLYVTESGRPVLIKPHGM